MTSIKCCYLTSFTLYLISQQNRELVFKKFRKRAEWDSNPRVLRKEPDLQSGAFDQAPPSAPFAETFTSQQSI